MTAPPRLPPELISLVHHVELNKAGWWDKAVQQLIVAAVWLSGESLTLDGVLDKLREYFSVDPDQERVRIQIDALRRSGTLMGLPDERFKISEQSLNQFEEGLRQTQNIHEQAQQRFIHIIAECCPSIHPQTAWQSFNEQFLAPLIRDMGARTYELISGTRVDLRGLPRLQHFLQRHPPPIRPDLRTAVIRFLNPREPSVRSYVLRQLCGYFFMEAGNLSHQTVQALGRMLGKSPSFNLFVDTNLLFCILGLDADARNQAAASLMRLLEKLANRVQLKLYISPITLDEARRVLRSCERDLGGIRLPRNLLEAGMASGVSGLARRFMEQSSKARQAVTAEDYFGPYTRGLGQIARAKGVELLGEEVDESAYGQEAADDVNEELEFEKRFGASAKRYEQVRHDVLLWHLVRTRRPVRTESVAEAGSWVVTLDFRFLGFDGRKRGNQVGMIPVCLHPATLAHMLQFWVPRTREFEEAVVRNLELPVLFQEFDASTEKATVRILAALARFEGVGDLSNEQVTSVLTDKALRQRLQAQADPEKRTELVREAAIQQNRRIRARLSWVQRKAERLEQKAREDAEAIADLKRRQREHEETIEESQRQVEEQRARRDALERRLAEVEGVVGRKQAEDEVRRFAARWVIAPLALIVALGLGVSLALGRLTQLAPLWSALTAVGACSVAFVAWVWLADLRGARDPAVSKWPPFRLLAALKNWAFATLLAAPGILVFQVIGNELSDFIRRVR